VAAVAVSACGLGAGATFAIGAFSQQASASSPVSGSAFTALGVAPANPYSPQVPVTQVQPAVAADFAILRRPQMPGDAIASAPASAVAVAAPSVGVSAQVGVTSSGVALMPAGVSLRLARSVAVPTSSLSAGRVWVLPGNGALCLRVVDPGGGDAVACQTTDNAQAGMLVGSLQPTLSGSGGAFVYGLAPDGVNQVTVTGANGSSQTVAVNDNVYATTISSAPQNVTLDDPDGQEVQVAAP
jgi:hypothetical protein